jgi:hypothetical protein
MDAVDLIVPAGSRRSTLEQPTNIKFWNPVAMSLQGFPDVQLHI